MKKRKKFCYRGHHYLATVTFAPCDKKIKKITTPITVQDSAACHDCFSRQRYSFPHTHRWCTHYHCPQHLVQAHMQTWYYRYFRRQALVQFSLSLTFVCGTNTAFNVHFTHHTYLPCALVCYKATVTKFCTPRIEVLHSIRESHAHSGEQ